MVGYMECFESETDDNLFSGTRRTRVPRDDERELGREINGRSGRDRNERIRGVLFCNDDDNDEHKIGGGGRLPGFAAARVKIIKNRPKTTTDRSSGIVIMSYDSALAHDHAPSINT